VDPAPHADLSSLTFLLGTWEGGGHGEYPTIEEFDYDEEVVIEHVGDPFLLYQQASWLSSDRTPLHFERGFIRPGGASDEVELCLAHPIGLTEIAYGTVDGTSVEISTATDGGVVGRARSGSAVTGLTRRYRVENDVLTYDLSMAMDETPMALHLRGTLRRRA
jgi:THAP4-like, heme-binding beta-barrel domain